jgi:hypothetical protein
MGLEEGRREPLRIVLDVEPGVEPISGTIASGSDPGEPFAGVMQLVAALDRMRGYGDIEVPTTQDEFVGEDR